MRDSMLAGISRADGHEGEAGLFAATKPLREELGELGFSGAGVASKYDERFGGKGGDEAADLPWRGQKSGRFHRGLNRWEEGQSITATSKFRSKNR